jgi:hypothetical protein
MRWLSSSLKPSATKAILALGLIVACSGWAAAATPSGPLVRACANKRTGALRLAGKCRRNERSVSWNQIGRQGQPGARGLAGATGPTGAPGPGGFSFAFGPMGDTPEQIIGTSFDGNQMRLKCGGGGCSAQVSIGSSGTILGTDVRGPMNAAVTSTKTISAETPSITTLTASVGAHMQGVGRAVVRLANGTGWQIDVELISDVSGNVRLIGTAIPATTNAGAALLCSPGFVTCPSG